MAKIKSRILKYTPSSSPDASEHRVRFVNDGLPFDYELPYEVVPSTPDVDGKVSVDISTLVTKPTTDGI